MEEGEPVGKTLQRCNEIPPRGFKALGIRSLPRSLRENVNVVYGLKMALLFS